MTQKQKCWACDNPGVEDLDGDGKRLWCQEHWDYAIDVAKHNCHMCGWAATFKTVGGHYRCTTCHNRMFDEAAQKARRRLKGYLFE